jgi:hypothetical protein
MAAKVVSLDLYQTVNSLKITGIKFLRNHNQRKKMNQKIQNGELYVMAKLYYHQPNKNTDFTVIRTWPCKDADDAEIIVKYHGYKTGAYNAECVMEIYNEEVIRQRIAEAKEIAEKAHKEKSSKKECAV